jgi:hypothetical protein
MLIKAERIISLMKYRQSFQYLGWSLSVIYLLILLLHIPSGFQNTNWTGLISVFVGSFAILFAITKTTYLTFENDDIVYVYGSIVRRKIPSQSIIRIVKGANTALGESFGKITYLVYQTPSGEQFVRLYVGFTDKVLKDFIKELLRKNPNVEIDNELTATAKDKDV